MLCALTPPETFVLIATGWIVLVAVIVGLVNHFSSSRGRFCETCQRWRLGDHRCVRRLT